MTDHTKGSFRNFITSSLKTAKSKFLEGKSFYKTKSNSLEENPFYKAAKSKFLEGKSFYTVVKPKSEERILKISF